jgi:hypothetical protein
VKFVPVQRDSSNEYERVLHNNELNRGAGAGTQRRVIDVGTPSGGAAIAAAGSDETRGHGRESNLQHRKWEQHQGRAEA